jgi:class 3 adenylate cyclase
MAAPALDSRLADVADLLERSRWAAELWDHEWRLAWVSPELKDTIGEHDEARLGYGRHLLECRLDEAWARTVTDRTRDRMFAEDLPYIAADTPGGIDAQREMVDDEFRPRLDGLVPVSHPPVRTGSIDFRQGSLPPERIGMLMIRLHDSLGSFLGTLFTYAPPVRPRLLTLIARGDQGMFERMARLIEPGRERTAILFADLQRSSALSRSLASGAYFELIRELTTGIDAEVVERRGIVGKHAGDGVTAFFLSHDLGSDSGAARAAVESAHAIGAAARRTGERLAADGHPATPEDCVVNIGVHWGGALYMGQVVTGGRLEVTALGDTVNEAARIQESARDGSVLASKALLERLEGDDARALGVAAERLRYSTLAELPEATDKARRDAGDVAVTTLTP